MTREKAEEIARDFLERANPTNWDGVGQKPDEFDDSHYYTYDIGRQCVELDISFDNDGEWHYFCDIVDKYPINGTVECCSTFSGDTINSCDDLTETIYYICTVTADWFYEGDTK